MVSERPLGITILAVLAMLFGLLSILGGLMAMTAGSAMGMMVGNEYGAAAAGMATASGLVAIILGIIELAVGWGLWNGKNWAWWLAVIGSALGVLGGLGGLVSSLALGGMAILVTLVNLLISLIILWYLFKPHVKEFFGITVEFST